jgi:hypothetical protein
LESTQQFKLAVSGFLNLIIWYKFTDVLEAFAATIVKAIVLIEVARTFKTSVNFNQTTWLNNPEDSHLHSRRRENLKSHQHSSC